MNKEDEEDGEFFINCFDCKRLCRVNRYIYYLSNHNEYICVNCGIKEVEKIVENRTRKYLQPHGHRKFCKCVLCKQIL